MRTSSRFHTFAVALVASVLTGLIAVGSAVAAPEHAEALKDAAHAAADAHGDAHGAHSGGGGTLLSFDVGSYLWKLIIFVTFFVLLAKFVWPPILKGLQGREEKQRRDLSTAEKAAKDAQTTLSQYKQQLAEAQKESQRMIEESRKQAEQLGARLKADADREITQMKDRAQKDIAAAKETALADIYEQSAVLSTQIAGKILKRELNPQDQSALVSESLAQLNHKKN
jgi:F-type H+-transporting ATPase subunit b